MAEPNADDADLVARARCDPAAFAPLYTRHVGPIYRYCYQIVGNREAAEEVTSQTFMRALASLARYEEGSFREWLFTIAHHAATDVRRQRPAAAIEEAVGAADRRPRPNSGRSPRKSGAPCTSSSIISRPSNVRSSSCGSPG